MRDEPEIMDAVQIEGSGSQAIEAREAGSWSVLVRTAKQYPRDLAKCIDQATQLATMDKETAEACFYTLPRAGKAIVGPSIRFAEIVQYSMKNIVVRAGVLFEARDHVVVWAEAIDLEQMIADRRELRANIVGKYGRYKTDMIGTTTMAAMAKAKRNAILGLIPRPVIARALLAAENVIAGDKTMAERWADAERAFTEMGVTKKQMLNVVGKSEPEQVTPADFLYLKTLGREIKKGEKTVDEAFATEEEKAPASATGKLEDLKKEKEKEKGVAEKSVIDGGATISHDVQERAKILVLSRCRKLAEDGIEVKPEDITKECLVALGRPKVSKILESEYDAFVQMVDGFKPAE